MITSQSPSRSVRLYSPAVYKLLQDIVLPRLLPGVLFAVLASAKTSVLIARLQSAGGASHFDLPLLVFFLQQMAGIASFGIVVFLVAIRRPVVGSHSSLTNALVALAGSFLLSVPVGAKVAEGNTLALALSSVLVIAGASFTVASLATLGRCFGLFPEARGLVTKGPYKFIRHPAYIAEMITCLGLTIGTLSAPLGALFLVDCGFQYWRARNEEAALRAVFPEYDDYCRRTPRFLPRLRWPSPSRESAEED